MFKQSLLQELFAELHWDSDKPNVRVQAIISKAVQVLDTDKDSPLLGRIQTADSSKDQLRCVSLTSVFKAIEKKGFYIIKETKDGVLEYGPLWAATNEPTLDRTVHVLKYWLNEVRLSAPDWWALGSAKGGGLAMNDGITSCIDVLRSVLAHLDQKGKKLLHLDSDDLVSSLKPYATALGRYFGGMSVEDRKRFRELRGIQGQTTRTRRCQQAIRERLSDFCPSGLDEFVRREKEQTNLRAKEVIDRIETALQKVILDEVKREFGSGESQWWVLGIPKQVRLQVTQKYENDDGKRGAKEAYFDLIDYRKIALDNWSIFQNLIGYGKKNSSKDKQTQWIATLNDKRNIVSHPSSGISLSMEELAELETYEAWFHKSLSASGAVDLDVNEDELEQEPTEQDLVE